jgi:broad specificity phosphatase PhoE
MTIRRLLLARHGQTPYNDARRFTGWHDPPLTRHGRAEARALGRRLREQQIDAVYCSDLQRTIETAVLALTEREAPAPVADAALREASFGDWQGLTFDEARERHPAEADALLARSIDFCAPGGETILQVHTRVTQLLAALHERHDGASVLVVASGGPIQILIADLFGMPIAAHWRLGVNNCALTVVDFVRGEPILSLLNDRSHLTRLRHGRRLVLGPAIRG